MELHIHYQGLSDQQVSESRSKYGDNVLTAVKRDSLWSIFIGNFNDPVIRILLIAAVIAIGIGFYTGSFIDGVGIIVAILLATFLAAINEYRASKEFEILLKYNEEKQVVVIRNGVKTLVDKKDIVVGDLVILTEGYEVPADGEIVDSELFKVDESTVTGEAEPFTKMSKVKAEGKIFDRAFKPYELFRSSTVVEGTCIMKVTGVGNSTEIGKTLKEVIEEEDVQTPLNKQLEKLSKLIGVVGFSVAFLTFMALFLRNVIVNEEFNFTHPQWYFLNVVFIGGLILLYKVWMPIVYDAFDLLGKEKDCPDDIENNDIKTWAKYIFYGLIFIAVFLSVPVLIGIVEAYNSYWIGVNVINLLIEFFMIAAVLIVVAVPEGLVMSVVLSQSYNMRKMKKEYTLVRKNSATETMGAATVICTDKTGTLTENRMSVSEFNMKLPHDHPVVIGSVVLNSTASLEIRSENGSRLVKRIGNHTEAALINYLYDSYAIDVEEIRQSFEVVKKKPFSTEWKHMATYGKDKENLEVNYLKGAPELILSKCSYIVTEENDILSIDKDESKRILQKIELFEKKGRRVLGFAYKYGCDNFEGDDFIFLGYANISDPLRKEVKQAIARSLEAGIEVKIITGDAKLTSQTIAEDAGIWENDAKSLHLSGQEFNNMSDDEAIRNIDNIKIISRATPDDKKRLVYLLQQANKVVAVTGDGINDAKALKSADVGLAMGSGTDLAQEASKIVIINDSFLSIMNGVKWGRSLYQNIQRFILFQLTINVATLTIAMLGPFVGLQIPLTAVQLLWINLIMDTFGALALATEAPNPDIMKEKPRSPNAFIISKEMTKQIFIDASVFVAILLFYLFYSGLNNPSAMDTHELMNKQSIFFTIFVLLNFWNLFNAKTFGMRKSVFKGFFENQGFVVIALVIFVGQILMIQFGGDFFRTIPISFNDWMLVIGLTSIVLWFGEIRRWFSRLKALKL
jgi:P-type Ca2+ transporter type 2C